jgi:hypothetical protein
MNDNFRTTLAFGAGIYMSREFYELSNTIKREAFERIRAYKNFGKGGHHDAGLILMGKTAIQWRIECRNLAMNGPSRDPSDPEQTIRVLIVELAQS